MVDLAALAKPFPREKVHWRAQTLTKDGNKAMALAYVDARDVMERLDEVCGPAGWQSEHFDCGGEKLGCKIGIHICLREKTEERDAWWSWVWKSDGAGETDIEGAKGAFSGAFKRAAVSWGIGRYLYDMDAVWVPCETTEWQGKKRFKRFTADPWSFVRRQDPAATGGQSRTTPAAKPVERREPPDQGRASADRPPQSAPPDAAAKDADSGGDAAEEATVFAAINAINKLPQYRETLLKWAGREKAWIEKCSAENKAKIRDAWKMAFDNAEEGEPSREDPPWEEDEAGRQDDHVRTVLDAG